MAKSRHFDLAVWHFSDRKKNKVQIRASTGFFDDDPFPQFFEERPILFSGAMVRALLDGSKTQTRRVVKPQPVGVEKFAIEEDTSGNEFFFTLGAEDDRRTRPILGTVACPYGQPGDFLWVRESLFLSTETNRHHYSATGIALPGVDYEAEPPPAIGLPARSIPSIHMPRWASRITLEITGVRVERLQDISESDALAEGVTDTGAIILGRMAEDVTGPIAEYAVLWESINGPGSWDANPWVWAVEFKRVQGGEV